jgi:hypothetical protein
MEIAGVISGLIAAVPGTIDYFFTVPPKSSARKRDGNAWDSQCITGNHFPYCLVDKAT